MSSKHKYIEIVRFEGDVVVKRLDITGKSDREADRIDNGMNINLDHENYFTREKEYDTPQALQPEP